MLHNGKVCANGGVGRFAHTGFAKIALGKMLRNFRRPRAAPAGHGTLMRGAQWSEGGDAKGVPGGNLLSDAGAGGDCSLLSGSVHAVGVGRAGRYVPYEKICPGARWRRYDLRGRRRRERKKKEYLLVASCTTNSLHRRTKPN